MSATEKLLWSEKYRQAGVVLATFWGLLVTIVVVLVLYASQREAALAVGDKASPPPPRGLGHVWLDVPPLAEAAPVPAAAIIEPPANELAIEEPVPEPIVAPGPAPAAVATAPAAEPAAAPVAIVEPIPEPAQEIVAEPLGKPLIEPAEETATLPGSQPAPPSAPEDVAEPATAEQTAATPAPPPTPIANPKDVFVVLLGGGDDFAVLDAMPAGSAMVLGVIDDNMAGFVAKAHQNNIRILLPLPVAESGPLPSLAAEPDENRTRFAAFLDQLPPVDGLFIPAGHPFNKDMASFAALMEEAKGRGLSVIGSIPVNLQTPTTPVPPHYAVDGKLLAGDAGNLEGVFFVLVGGNDDVTVITGPADLAFARALGAFAQDSTLYNFAQPKEF